MGCDYILLEIKQQHMGLLYSIQNRRGCVKHSLFYFCRIGKATERQIAHRLPNLNILLLLLDVCHFCKGQFELLVEAFHCRNMHSFGR